MASSDPGLTARHVSRVSVAIITVLAVASCAHSTPGAGKEFDDQKRVDVRCLNHQTHRPGPAYTSTTKADTSKILVMLHYYVANGSKPYCNGGRASTTDRSWAQTFVTLGGKPELVASILIRR